MKKINEGRGILNGMPCHKYIIRHLASERDILEFERSFIETMYEYDIPDDDIETALGAMGTYIPKKSPVWGRSFNIAGNGPHIGGIASSVLFDSDIPSYGKCVSYYRKFDKNCHACVLCDISKRYTRLQDETELKIIRFILDSRENFLLLKEHGLQSSLFHSSMDITEYAASPRCYPFALYKNIIEAVPPEEPGTEYFSPDGLPAKVCNFLHGKMRRMRLPDAYAEKTWLDKVILIWAAMIYACELVPADSAVQLLARLSSTPDAAPESGIADTALQAEPCTEKPCTESGCTGGSGNPPDNTMQENGVPVRETHSPLSETGNGGLWQRYTPDSGRTASHGTGVDNPSSVSDEPGILKEPCSVDSGTPAADNSRRMDSPGKRRRTTKKPPGKRPDVDARPGKDTGTDEDTCPAGNTQAESRHPDSGPGCGPQNGRRDRQRETRGTNLPSTAVIEVISNDEIYDEPVIDAESRAIDEKDCYPRYLEMKDDLVFVPSLRGYELENGAVPLDTGNVMILTKFENAVLHDGSFSIEAFKDEHGEYGLLIWVSGLGALFYTYMRDRRASEIIFPLISRKAVRKICYSPYLLYALMRRHGVRIRSLHSIQTVCYLQSGRDVQDRNDYISVLLSYNVRPVVPGMDYKTSGNVNSLVFSYLPLYGRVYRKQMRRISRKSIAAKAEKYEWLNEALGSSYLAFYLDRAGRAAFKMPKAGLFHFEKVPSDSFRIDGRILLLSPKGNSPPFFFNDVVIRIAESGLFHSCVISILLLTGTRLGLFVAETDFEYVMTFINMGILECKTTDTCVAMNIGYLMVGPAALAKKKEKELRHKDSGNYDTV